jgi:pimeloyl-ACP methyl ester carboxylesterase
MTLIDAALIPEHIEHRITLPDDRTLAAAEWGDPDGLPFISLHGTPGGRIGWWEDPDIYRRFRLRRITYDRPGYGDSTRHPGRTVADGVADVEHLSAALGIDRFVVSGGSGGGPHALAVAALLPERVIRCIADVSVAPFDAEGLDWMAGMTEGNLVEFGAAVEGEAAARAVVEPLREVQLARLAEGRLDWMGDDYELSDADREQMRKHLVRVRAHIANGLAPGPDGWIDDLLVFVKPWGFDVASIRVPVLVSYGRTDVLVPASHGDWLATHVPGAEVWSSDASGHLGDDDAIERQYAWLTGQAAAPARSEAPLRRMGRSTGRRWRSCGSRRSRR